MPTYGYECTTCHHSFDVFQKITADPVNTCPKCGNQVKRLIDGGIGIIFKGSGFYTTDYKNSSAPGTNGSSTEKNAESKESSKESSKDTSKEGKKEKSQKDS